MERDEAIRHIFKLWRGQGLKLSLKKSRLKLQTVKFFGKVFSSKGISPDIDKVAALKAAGPPQSAAEVKFFYSSLEQTRTSWKDLQKPCPAQRAAQGEC